MDKRLLSYDPLNGISTYHSYDNETDTSTLIYTGDCQPVLEANKARANDPDFSKKGIKEEFWLYASIPTMLQLKWLIEEGIDVYKERDAGRVSQKLEDPEFRFLKCTSKKHIIIDR